MTLYDKGLIRAMKKAYKDGGYYVAMTDRGVLIQTDTWGVEILAAAVPNSIKSLIVLHCGAMPRMDSAVMVGKEKCGEAILEAVAATMDELTGDYTWNGGRVIKPTRLTFDGCRVWQTANDLQVQLVEPEDQQILAGEKWDARLVRGCIYGRNWFGAMYIRTRMPAPEDRGLLEHMAQLQWIPVELV